MARTIDKPARRRLVNLSRLTPAEKQQTWKTIQRNNAPLARLLTDPNLRLLQTAFDGEVLVEKEAIHGEH